MTDIKPMKILFFISSLKGGGAELVASRLCNDWAENDQQVVLVTLDSKHNDFYKSSDKIKRYALNILVPSTNLFTKVKATINRLLKFRKIVQQEKPDVVVSFIDVSNMLAILACLFTKTPVIISERTYPPYFNRNNMFDLWRKLIYKLSTGFVAQTTNVAKWAEQFLSVTKIKVISNPIDNNSLATDLNQVRNNSILAVGRLCSEKGFDLLINAFHQCYAEYPDWELLIVGEGPERSNLEVQLKQLNLQTKVKLIGQVELPKLYYATAKIFVLSSRVEGFPNVLLEAMAHQLAVISFDCASGPADIINNGVNGLLVPQHDQVQLVLALQTLMQDVALRDKLAAEAIKVRDKYRLDLISAQWLKLFNYVVYANKNA